MIYSHITVMTSCPYRVPEYRSEVSDFLYKKMYKINLPAACPVIPDTPHLPLYNINVWSTLLKHPEFFS